MNPMQQPLSPAATDEVEPSPQVEEPKKPLTKSEQIESDPDKESKRAAVRQWTGRINSAKKKYEGDFKRMVENVNFTRGMQREGQSSPESGTYAPNITLRNVNQKVAVLYARNPVAEWQKRKRLVYQVWDGKLETLLPVAQKLAAGMPPAGSPPTASKTPP